MPQFDVYRVHLNPNKIIPLALGNIVAMVKKYHPELLESLNFQTPWLTDPAIIRQKSIIKRFLKPSIFLMSNYVWNRQAHTLFSHVLKKGNPNHLIIHGGPAIPYRTSTFLEENTSVDFTVHGEGEFTCMELLQQICSEKDFMKVKGISFRNDHQILMTEWRDRIENLSIIPSPYLGAEFDSLLPEFDCAVVETNRGCPYKCAYCSWGFYLRRIIKNDLDRVFEELEWIAKHRIPAIWIADANFGILEQDISIAEHLCHLKERYGFPKNVITNYANNKRRSIEISRLFIKAKISTSLCIAMQTTDQQTLQNIYRKPFPPNYFQTLRDEYVQYQLPVMTHLMIGLPGSTFASFKQDINQALEEKMYLQIFPTIVLPNTALAEPEYRKQHGVITEVFKSKDYDEDWDVVVAMNSFSRDEYRDIHLFCGWIHFAVCYRTLKYLTYYVSTETTMKQGDVLEQLLQIAQKELGKNDQATRYPILQAIVRALQEKVSEFFDQKICQVLRRNPRELYLKMDESNQWDQFYHEISDILIIHFGLDSDMTDAVIQFQKSILPSRFNSFSTIESDYDFVSYYFQDTRHTSKKSLSEFMKPILFSVKDPKKLCSNIEQIETSMRFLLNNFELDSALWRNE
ncbi:MAG: radical SAM protein [Desulfobacterales bacterium]|nr:radical SAM protein [Desulfobacterales bacterium]